jgi:proteasome lid subunit RPN8/RPN11
MGAAKKVYPLEFISMLSVSEENLSCLSELVILPAEYGWDFSELRTDLIPFDPLIVGSVHSHPTSSMRPSSADRLVFARLGKIHLILGHPYGISSFSAYDSNGKKILLPIV